MKKINFTSIVLVSAISLLLLSSCRLMCVRGSGNMITENRAISEFTKLDVSGEYKVVLKQDSSLSLKINADDNLLKYIKTSVSNGKLRIYSKKSLCSSGQIVINIGVRSLQNLEAAGAVDVVSDGKITTGDIHFDLS